MSKPKLSPLIERLIYADQNRLLQDPVGRAVRTAIEAGVANDFERKFLKDRVERHHTAQAFAGPFPDPQFNGGEIILGRDRRGRLIHVPLSYFNAHALTIGGSGCGKTTRIYWLSSQIPQFVAGCWWFDFRKREFSRMQRWLEPVGIDLIIIPGRALRLNPLQVPDGVNPREWASRVADLLVLVVALPERAAKLIHRTVLMLFEKFGVLDGGGNYPTLFDLREAIARTESAHPQARQAVVDSLDPILMSLRSVLCYRQGWSTTELAQRHIVFELSDLAEADKDLILNTLLMQEFTSRIAKGSSNRRMDLWICCDEAQRIVSARNAGLGLGDLIGLVRGTGIGVDLSVQSADVIPSVVSNTAIKLIGRCGAAGDYDLMAGAMGLTAEQRRILSLTLVPGLFCVQVGEGNWRHPFLCRIPPLKTDGTSDVQPPRDFPQLIQDERKGA